MLSFNMSMRSAGLVLYRLGPDGPEFLLVHPGGPYWAKKDQGAWSIPKGEYEEGEDPLDAAIREVEEEIGTRIEGDFTPLTPIHQKGGKTVLAWAVPADLHADVIRSNTFTMEWPPRSGRTQSFPEVDRAAWMSLEGARGLVNPAQLPLLEEAADILRR